MKMRTRIGFGDVIVSLTAVLLALLILLPQLNEDGGKEKTVLIKTDSDETVYDLSVDREISLHSSGYEVTVKIKDNAVCVINSDCPDRVCISSGWVEDSARPIICAPAKVLIRIQNGGGDTDADFIAGR